MSVVVVMAAQERERASHAAAVVRSGADVLGREFVRGAPRNIAPVIAAGPKREAVSTMVGTGAIGVLA